MLPDGPEHAKGHATLVAEKVCKRGPFAAGGGHSQGLSDLVRGLQRMLAVAAAMARDGT